MTKHPRPGNAVIVGTFIVALILTIVPLPEAARPLRPEWVALVLIYWCLATPERVGVGVAWVVGLLVDTLTGTLLGQHALAFCIVAFLTLNLYRRIRLFPLWQQSVTVLILLAIYQALNLWVSGIVGRPVHTWKYWMPSIAGMLLWPLVFKLLRRIRRHFQVG